VKWVVSALVALLVLMQLGLAWAAPHQLNQSGTITTVPGHRPFLDELTS